MENKKLYIVWTNADPVSSELMVMMYATNSMINKWWDEVTVVIWGAPSKLICENKRLQEKMREAENVGVKFSACLTCANELGTRHDLENLGLEVKRWGALLTQIIKSEEKVITV